MTKIVQNLRGPVAQVSVQTLPVGVFVMDTTSNCIRVHDGITPGGHKTLVASNNLADLDDVVTARSSLQLGSAALANTSDFDPAGSAALRLLKTANLSDLANVVTARTNLGLGTAAVMNVQGLGTEVATIGGSLTDGHLPRITNTGSLADSGIVTGDVALNSDNLNALTNKSTARTNLGVPKSGNGTNVLSTTGTLTDGNLLRADNANNAVDSGYSANLLSGLDTAAYQPATAFLNVANNLGDLNNAATARTNLGFSKASTAGIAITLNSAAEFNHGFGALPTDVTAYLVCTTANLGYAIGDCVVIPAAGSNTGIGLYFNTTKYGYSFGASAPQIMHKTAGGSNAITLASWTLTITAHKNGG